MSKRYALILSMLLASGLVACGGGGGETKSDEEQIREVMADFAAAALDEDFEKACSLMTSAAKQELLEAAAFVGSEGGGCPGVLKAALSLSDEAERKQLENYELTSVRIKGNTAAVEDYTGESGRLRKEGRTWLIDKDPSE